LVEVDTGGGFSHNHWVAEGNCSPSLQHALVAGQYKALTDSDRVKIPEQPHVLRRAPTGKSKAAALAKKNAQKKAAERSRMDEKTQAEDRKKNAAAHRRAYADKKQHILANRAAVADKKEKKKVRKQTKENTELRETWPAVVSQQRINAALNDFLDATSFPAALERPCAVCACDCPSKDITDFDVPLDSVARADEGKADGKAAAPVRGPSDAPVAKWRAVLQQDAIQPPPAG